MHIYLFIYLLFSAGDGRWRHHRCIPAADRRSLLNPPLLVGSHPKIFPSVTFTVPLLVSDYNYYYYSSLHLKKFFTVPSWCSMGLINVLSQTELNFVHVNSLFAGQSGQRFLLAPQATIGPTAFHSSYWCVSPSQALSSDSLVSCNVWSPEAECILL